MKRFAIRDNTCTKPVKPRIFDLIITDEGERKLEVKDGKVTKSILLDDVQKQIDEFSKQV